jgi:hypothetical protein
MNLDDEMNEFKFTINKNIKMFLNYNWMVSVAHKTLTITRHKFINWMVSHVT